MESPCITQRTCLAKGKQKEREDIDSNKKVVNKLETSLSILEPILIESFGYEGTAVFVQKFNGNMLLTRSGQEILDNVLLVDVDTSDPIEKFLLSYCKKINSVIGDGTKRFIFYVNAFIKLIKKDSLLVSKRLSELKTLQYVFNISKCSYFLDSKSSLSLSKYEVGLVIRNFMLNRFASPVAVMFSELVVEWILSIDDVISCERIKFLSRNLDSLCVKSSEQMPLAKSKVQIGFLVNGKISNLCKFLQTESMCTLQVFLYNDEDLSDLKKSESDLIRLISLSDFENNKILLITNITLSESLLFYLRIRNVVSVEGVVLEDVIFINDYLLKYNISKEFTTNFKYTDNNTVWISLPHISQLILCLPTNDLWLQLRESLKNVVTLIDYSLTNSNIICDTGNYFELLMYDFIRKRIGICHCNKPPLYINNRKELLEWHDLQKKLNDKNLHYKNDYSLTVRNIGKDSYKLVDFISYLIERIVSEKELANDCFLIFLCDLFYYVVRLVRPKGLDNNDFNYLELVAAKLEVFSYSIDFVLQLFNISSVVYCKK